MATTAPSSIGRSAARPRSSPGRTWPNCGTPARTPIRSPAGPRRAGPGGGRGRSRRSAPGGRSQVGVREPGSPRLRGPEGLAVERRWAESGRAFGHVLVLGYACGRDRKGSGGGATARPSCQIGGTVEASGRAPRAGPPHLRNRSREVRRLTAPGKFDSSAGRHRPAEASHGPTALASGRFTGDEHAAPPTGSTEAPGNRVSGPRRSRPACRPRCRRSPAAVARISPPGQGAPRTPPDSSVAPDRTPPGRRTAPRWSNTRASTRNGPGRQCNT